MAKKFTRIMAMLLVLATLFSVISVGAFAAETYPINKTNNGLTNDQTDVTLTVPGTFEGAIDVVFVLGGGMTANMKTIESAINVFKPAMESGKATVRMGLISLEKGKEIILDLNSDEAVLDPATYVDFVTEKFDSINDLPAGTTNLHSQLVEAQKMLAKETKAKAENKYVFVLATGRTYWFDDANGEQAMVVNKVKGNDNNTYYYWGNYLYQSQRGGNTSLYMIPASYNNSYKEYFADIEKWVAADGDKYVFTPHFGVNDYSAYANWNAKNNKDLRSLEIAGSRYGNGIVDPKPTAENFVNGEMNAIGSGFDPKNALNYERAQYESIQVWKELVDAGYNCYSICSEASNYQNGSENIKSKGYKGKSTIQVGHAFMDYLAELAGQGKAPVVWEYQRDEDGNVVFYTGKEGNYNYAYETLKENFFDSVRDDILYTTSKGSTVEDFIGKNEYGNFEFIENADYIKLNVAGADYTTKMTENTDEGSKYTFTAPGASEPTFWLDYYYGDGETTERFVWTFGETVTMERLASLTYKLQLTDKVSAEGTYKVPTNNSATLYPKDSDGKDRDPQVFPVPEVQYTVVSKTDVVIKKVDGNGAPLTGAEFELFNASGESLGKKTVDANGELTFEGLRVGTYTLKEVKAPNGYKGLDEPIAFEVVRTKDKFEVSVLEEYVVHFPATAYEISNHSYYPAIPQTFVLLNAEDAETWTYPGEYAFGGSNYDLVYCADSETGAENGAKYQKYAIEDVFPEKAGKLRAIIANSYPYVSMNEMIAAATAAGVADAANLTRGDLIAAVQLAIWKLTNGADHTYRATYSVPNYPQWGKVYHDYSYELPDGLPKNTTKYIQDAASSARVEALYNYLLDLTPLAAGESAVHAVCYVANDGKGASQTMIGGIRNDTTITVKNYESIDVDIVLALGAGIAKEQNTYDSIVTLVKPLIDEGINVKLGLVAVEHYKEVAMGLTPMTADNYESVIANGLNTIKGMPAGPTNLEACITAAHEMLDGDRNVPYTNKFFHVIATGRTYCFDDIYGNPATIVNQVALKGKTEYYWGHYLWQSQRGRHTSLYMIPDKYNNSYAAFFEDIKTWVENDQDKFVYTFPIEDYSKSDWYTTYFGANTKDAKALGLASSRFGWIFRDPAVTAEQFMTTGEIAAIGSGASPANALNYERGQYDAYMAFQNMKAAGYNCCALCSESVTYQNDSPYIDYVKYTGTSRAQLGHSFMNFLNGGEATLLYQLTDNNGNYKMAENFFAAVDTSKLSKRGDAAYSLNPVQKLMMSTGPKLTITNELPDTVEGALGQTVSVTVEVKGEGLKYQWYFKDANAEEFSKSSTKVDTYEVEMTKARAGRDIYCVVTDKDGRTVTSKTVKLVRVAAEELTIVTQPTDVEGALGQTVAAKVEAKGEGLKYRWYFQDAGADKFSASSITTDTYEVEMTKARAGRSIYCVITDAVGNTVTTDTVKLIRVAAEELAIVNQPEDEEIYAEMGETLKVTIEAKGESLKYQWYFRDAKATKFSASSTKVDTYEVEMNKTRADREIYCVITDALGNKIESNHFFLRAGTAPVTEPTEPATEPTEPATEPTEPATEPTEPATEPTEPATEPVAPAAEEPGEPAAEEPSEPAAEAPQA